MMIIGALANPLLPYKLLLHKYRLGKVRFRTDYFTCARNFINAVFDSLNHCCRPKWFADDDDAN